MMLLHVCVVFDTAGIVAVIVVSSAQYSSIIVVVIQQLFCALYCSTTANSTITTLRIIDREVTYINKSGSCILLYIEHVLAQ